MHEESGRDLPTTSAKASSFSFARGFVSIRRNFDDRVYRAVGTIGKRSDRKARKRVTATRYDRARWNPKVKSVDGGGGKNFAACQRRERRRLESHGKT